MTEKREQAPALPKKDVVKQIAILGSTGSIGGQSLSVVDALRGRFSVVALAAAQRAGRELLPVDSEHNAVDQCLRGGTHGEVRRLVLTASGGPFRKTPLAALANVTTEQALAHPNWRMGNRITIDSATMMNKGFEIIEARLLFGMRPDQIEGVVHPQSTIHSMMGFVDGSVLAQLGPTGVRVAIHYALTNAMRLAPAQLARDLAELKRLA